jgi:cell division protein FtsB
VAPRGPAITGPAGPAAATRRPGAARKLRDNAARLEALEQERAEEARHRRHIGFRAVILLVLIGAAFAVTFTPVRTYLAQQQELRVLRADVEAARKSTDDLEAELARWNDPAYIQAQARERLGYVNEGDVAFKVVDAENAPAVETAPTADDAAGTTPLGAVDEMVPWYTRLWDSVLEAGIGTPATPGDSAEGAGVPDGEGTPTASDGEDTATAPDAEDPATASDGSPDKAVPTQP